MDTTGVQPAGGQLQSGGPKHPATSIGSAQAPRLHRVGRALARIPTWSRTLAFYLVFAILTIGRYAILHPRTVCACGGSQDPAIFMWALAWWPHAIAHGLNPFVTHYQWAPTGANLAQGTMVPTAAIVTAPFTALFGPLFSYNAISIASPALSAFTAYLLCRRLVKRELPAVAGGFLFGFSSYEFGQLLGHLHLVMIFLIPVMVHITLRRVDREISRRAYLFWMALLLVLQMGLSTEWLAECVALGMVLLVAARFLAAQPQRARLTGLIGETIAAGLIAIVVSSPFLYYAVISGGFQPGNPLLSNVFGLDLTNLLFPTQTTWLGHHDFQALWSTYEVGDVSETNGYLSIAIVIAFATWFFTEGRRGVLGRLLAIAIVVSIVVALGSQLHVGGRETMSLPFNWVKNVAVFNNIIPSRTVLFAVLAISIGVSAWLAKTGGHAFGRWLLVLVGVVMLFPNLSPESYGSRPYNPSFFSTGMYRNYLTRNETVLILPFGHNDISTLWQAETGFYFYMPEGYVLGTVPPAFESQPGVKEMVSNVPPTARVLRSFIRAHVVSHVVVDRTKEEHWPALLAQLGLHGRPVGGVLLYSVPGAPG
jgi:hypothetical protein